MKVSVIIPNYNHAQFLNKRVSSILNQTFKDFELIILDDFSTDNSREIIERVVEENPSIKTIFNQANSGSPFIQWNRGVREAKGEYIWIAESDDYAHESFLQRCVDILDNKPNVGLVHCNSNVIDLQNGEQCTSMEWNCKIDNKKWREDYINRGDKEICSSLCVKATINNVSSVLFRKEAYISCGYAKESMHYCGDWQLYISILSKYGIAYICDPLNTIRIHSQSTLNKYFKDPTYLKEVTLIYLQILRNNRVTMKKKMAMVRNLIGLIRANFKSSWRGNKRLWMHHK